MNSPPKKSPGAGELTGRRDYGTLWRFLRCVQRPFYVVGWWIEQECAEIETAHELDKWNRELESEP